MADRMQHCDWCGEELGVYDKPSRDYESCGKAECEREVRDQYRAERDEAQYAAERDDYERYRSGAAVRPALALEPAREAPETRPVLGWEHDK